MASTQTWIRRLLLLALVLFFAPVGCMVAAHYGIDNDPWSGHSRYSSTEQAPDADSDIAVIQVYAARAARWRGAFGVHTWIATKKQNERQYTRLEVMGFQLRWGSTSVRIRSGTPDGIWFGNYPVLLREITGGSDVERMIDTLHEAARNYEYESTYSVWPGPNSNTFIAHLARKVPQLRLELPSHAVGKDYLPGSRWLAKTPSGTGVQMSFNGYGGLLLGLEEGIEINLLGLTAGIDFYPPALKLPAIGRLGFPDIKRRHIAESDSRPPHQTSAAEQPASYPSSEAEINPRMVTP